MGGRVKLTDVAREAGVSASAVSRVFTPGASASPATVIKVREAAERLGYRPHRLARSLTTGRSRIIGVVVAYLENYFYPQALELLSGALQAQGYHVLVFLSGEPDAEIDHIIEEILDHQVDGVIMASVPLSSGLATRAEASGVPVVLFNRRQEPGRFVSVTSDNEGGGHAVGRFLVAGGHERIAYIAGWEGASTQSEREAGFLRALREAGTEIHDRAIGNYRWDRAAEAARTLCDRPARQRPDAIFVANDHMAFAVMDVLRGELGLDVPDDVSVVGFDDATPAAWHAYQLTTVRQRARRMVEATVELLLSRIEGEGGAVPAETIIEAPLVVRRSARVPKNWPKNWKENDLV